MGDNEKKRVTDGKILSHMLLTDWEGASNHRMKQWTRGIRSKQGRRMETDGCYSRSDGHRPRIVRSTRMGKEQEQYAGSVLHSLLISSGVKPPLFARYERTFEV